MKKLIYFLISSLIICVYLQSCDKAPLPDYHAGVDRPNTLREDPNYEDYEDSLNIFHVTNVDLVDSPEIESVWFDHDDGYIDGAEWARIKDTISDMVGSGSPQIIDIDVEDDSIYIYTDDSGAPDPFPDDVKPDGGYLPGVGIISGSYCNNTSDVGGGGLGRTVRGFFSGKSPHSSTDRYSDIRNLYIYGNCSNVTYTLASGSINRYDSDIWHDKTSCVSHLSCLDIPDLEAYVDAIESIESNELPNGYRIIAIHKAEKSTSNEHWYIRYKFGTAVAD
ncbi:MAG: hypothetical protein R3275_01315 [Saprospiraceae bacterium]|nr:hypothetical protein [Saprospiraceae bacterium]